MRAWSEGQADPTACPNCGWTSEQQRAEQKRQELVAALLEERRGTRDAAHRKAIDEQLAYHGHKAA
jgi:hypothetical protein